MVKNKDKSIKIGVGLIFSWIFGVILVLASISNLVSGAVASGLVYLLTSCFIFPPITKIIQKKFNIQFSRTIKIIVFFVGIILAANLMTATIVEDINNNQNTNNQPNTEAITQKEIPVKEVEKSKETLYSMNQNIDVDYISYKITGAETFTEMGTSMFKKETEGKFVKVYLKLTNNAKETKQIFSPRFKIKDSKGRKYDRLSDDMMYISDYLEFGKQIQPGLATSGAIVFELPTDSTDLKVLISGDWISIRQVEVSLSEIKNIGKDTTQKDEQDDMMDEAMADSQKQIDELMRQYS